ncbi:GNAT family N-acetyltransferase [Candidatus Solirubrobacter pratensis]|uniref:GNAT family N-acetyltransferase n=1 Tax=Candidatus Solirubrobacter pratensis TaxID=1298857 RepID=UPI000686FB58|nr:GNAT family N-acetyltransferase [Candidatus Solirubrobacter pratensis]
MQVYVEPSPAGGYFVRLRGEGAPLSHHDTEEEAEAAAAAYHRGLAHVERATELVVLRDGSEVLVRQARADDKPLFVAGWSGLFAEIDHVDHEAIGALADRAGVGVARYVRDTDRPHMAEAAVVVIDAWQGRGLGAKLLRRLCARATENGIRVFTATLLASSDAMLALLSRLGAVEVRRREGPAIEVDVELPVELGTLEHVLREAAERHVKQR